MNKRELKSGIRNAYINIMNPNINIDALIKDNVASMRDIEDFDIERLDNGKIVIRFIFKNGTKDNKLIVLESYYI